MGQITGYQIKLSIGSGEWNPTTDQVFLGVHTAKNGGREFALNTEGSMSQAGQEVTLFVGERCCEEANGLTIQNSLNWGWNGPKNHPIQLDEVEYVYLRKFEGGSRAAHNYLVLSAVDVMACDGSSMRRWVNKSYGGPLPFHRDIGLKHWLVETKPPRCVLVTTLRSIEHTVPGTSASKPAGYDWKLSWGVHVNNQPTANVYSNTTTFKQNDKKIDNWIHWVQQGTTRTVRGCCPTTVKVHIDVKAIELDRTLGGRLGGIFSNELTDGNPDDTGAGQIEIELDCTDPSEEPQVVPLVAVCTVDPKPKAKLSTLKWNFSVSAICAS